MIIVTEVVVNCCRDELLAGMQRFLAAVKTLLNAFTTQEQASESRLRLQQQLTYLTEAQSAVDDDAHPVHMLVSRSAACSELMITSGCAF